MDNEEHDDHHHGDGHHADDRHEHDHHGDDHADEHDEHDHESSHADLRVQWSWECSDAAGIRTLIASDIGRLSGIESADVVLITDHHQGFRKASWPLDMLELPFE